MRDKKQNLLPTIYVYDPFRKFADYTYWRGKSSAAIGIQIVSKFVYK